MTRPLVPLLALILLAGAALAAPPRHAETLDLPQVAIDGPGVMLHGRGDLATLSKVGPDSFVLFGGPEGDPCDLDPTEGKFQDILGAWPDRQGWIGIDLTDLPTLWQWSLFNMENLGDHGVGNRGMWCGRRCDQVTGWDRCPGYGNAWFAILSFERDYLGDPAVGQTVGLDFYFNHDTEPGYDYLQVYYDSAGSWTQVWQQDGSNKDTGGGGVDWPAPGMQYSLEGDANPIRFVGDDYGGDDGDKIALRLVVNSDSAWSDEDGLWPTDAGAAQVDDITVSYEDGVAKSAQSVFEDFEGTAPFAWVPEKHPFVGDFSKIFVEMSDNDPCRENETPILGFIDDGTPPANPDNQPPLSTGGETSASWTYGIPGGWVVNYNGGLSYGERPLRNEAWSPPFEWDLPCTTADDSPFYAGSVLRFTVWRHLPLANGIFYLWHVRHSTDGGVSWSGMRDRNLVYYGSEGLGDWLQVVQDTSDLIHADPDSGDPVTHVQIGLAAWDYAEVFQFPGNDATPSPTFDDVAFLKYRVAGPAFSTRTIDTFQDCFPNSGNTDFTTLEGRQVSDCRIDMAREIGGRTTVNNVKGDSLIVDVRAIIPNTSLPLSNMLLRWILDINPLFDDVRVMPPGTTVSAGAAWNGWDQWSGEVEAQQSTTSVGAVVWDRYFWDLPDENFAHPGDVLYYYVEATDTGPNGGNTTTLPAILDGFGTPDYHRAFTVRFLPTVVHDGGGGLRQPKRLLVNDFGRRGGEDLYLRAFGEYGLDEGRSFDTYTVQGPSSNVGNGIGASGSGGATADQLAGYDTIIYVAGDLGGMLLSDGSDSGLNDKGNDLETLSQWHDLPGDRTAAFFADNIASATSTSSAAGATFVGTILNVSVNDADVRDEIGGQTAPRVVDVHGAFSDEYIVFGGCLGINTFDSITPGTGAVMGHQFTDRNGVPITTVAASVIHDRVQPDGDRIVDMTFPYGFVYVWNTHDVASYVSVRTKLMWDILTYGKLYFGPFPDGQDPIARRGVYDLHNTPNPFNPSTTVHFTLGAKSLTTVKVYNLRGELVSTLASEIMDAGRQTVIWDGRDRHGASVASGVYVIRVEGDREVQTRKVALVK